MINNITFSIDDGDPLDLKIAKILSDNNKKAIFYIPIKKRGSKKMANKEIRSLSNQFEIGGHTYNHIDLTKVSLEKARQEIIDGKNALEDIIGKKIRSFAFPYGHYNGQLIKLVKKVGFKNCRSGRIINFHEFNDNDFLQHPNFQIYPHKLSTDVKHCLKMFDYYSLFRRLKQVKLEHLDLLQHLSFNKKIHIWFHSKDIEDYNLWKLFTKISRRIL
ncbi:MAG: polysaccharide deacetylase family protein [Patescibacteria group bacterium]